uniref:Uncharacterized protein n=1 Tax=Sphaerodactylus townsendi TaxID=933632 RepID=A0ACB8F8T9_9SAUR
MRWELYKKAVIWRAVILPHYQSIRSCLVFHKSVGEALLELSSYPLQQYPSSLVLMRQAVVVSPLHPTETGTDSSDEEHACESGEEEEPAGSEDGASPLAPQWKTGILDLCHKQTRKCQTVQKIRSQDCLT